MSYSECPLNLHCQEFLIIEISYPRGCSTGWSVSVLCGEGTICVFIVHLIRWKLVRVSLHCVRDPNFSLLPPFGRASTTHGSDRGLGLVQDSPATHFLETPWCIGWRLETLGTTFSKALGVSVNLTVPLDGSLNLDVSRGFQKGHPVDGVCVGVRGYGVPRGGTRLIEIGDDWRSDPLSSRRKGHLDPVWTRYVEEQTVGEGSDGWTGEDVSEVTGWSQNGHRILVNRRKGRHPPVSCFGVQSYGDSKFVW